MGRAGPRTRRDWHDAFLTVLSECGLLYKACDAVGVRRSTVWKHRQENEDFALRYEEAQARYVERLQSELQDRIFNGKEKPVYQGGKLVGHVREFTDISLIFELKKHDPSYRDTYRVEHSGPDGGPIQVQAPPDAEERSRRAAALLAEAGGLFDVDGEAEDDEPPALGNGNGHR